MADELSCARPALLLKPNESNRYQWANRNSQISNRPRRITDQSIDHPDLGDKQISGTNITASKGFNQTLIYVTHTATSLQTSPGIFTLAAHNSHGWVTGFTTAILGTASVYSPSSPRHLNTDPLGDLHQEECTSKKERSGWSQRSFPKNKIGNKGGTQLLACCVAAAGLIQTYKSTMPTPKNTRKHPFQVMETCHKMSVLSNINYILTCRSVLDCSLATDRRAGPQTISPVAHDRPAVPPAINATHTAHASAVQRSVPTIILPVTSSIPIMTML